ncbi:hypothetical protein MP228_006574 [Amoeboaphelidium protococcarum]|nr:hypothetical protein MP228_006574 [Amoeboaphelidium protococcarum]
MDPAPHWDDTEIKSETPSILNRMQEYRELEEFGSASQTTRSKKITLDLNELFYQTSRNMRTFQRLKLEFAGRSQIIWYPPSSVDAKVAKQRQSYLESVKITQNIHSITNLNIQISEIEFFNKVMRQDHSRLAKIFCYSVNADDFEKSIRLVFKITRFNVLDGTIESENKLETIIKSSTLSMLIQNSKPIAFNMNLGDLFQTSDFSMIFANDLDWYMEVYEKCSMKTVFSAQIRKANVQDLNGDQQLE